MFAPHARARHGYLAGSDSERAADLNRFFRSEEIDAIWCLRGGYGCLRILDQLDYEALRSSPKAVIGYSDITALHAAIGQLAGVVSFHGPMAGAEISPYAQDALQLLRGTETPHRLAPPPRDGAPTLRTLRGGRARGPLVGGNLSVLTRLLGTPFEPVFAGCILFLEDIGEAAYRIDGYLSQLRLAGHLASCAGIALGHFSDTQGPQPDPLSVDEMLSEVLGDLEIPIYRGLACGHVPDQAFLPLGVEVEIDADAGSLRLLHPAVA